ncbi:MAG: hypothetical protein KF679_04690 [Chitinophagaceae bacterium]|nr:hypothetical protein [Chitinophagaceae bacterium]
MKEMEKGNLRNDRLVLNPYFSIGLFLLIINDSFLKWQFHNAFTGKLSDFAGLFIFPMFLAFLFPRLKTKAVIITALFFVLWKSPFSTGIIKLLNLNPFFHFHREIDYSDYTALLILPFTGYLMRHRLMPVSERQPLFSGLLLNISILTAFIAFTATSIGRYEIPKGTVLLDKRYSISLPKDTILSRIEQMGYPWEYHEKDSNLHVIRDYYQVNNFIVTILDRRDTIDNVKFRLIERSPKKSELHLINVTLQNPGNIQSWRYLKVLSRRYRQLLKKELIREIKQ